VIVGHFRAILFQALCLALTFVCLAAANGQTNPILKSAEESPATSEIDPLFKGGNELSAKKASDDELPLLNRILLLTEMCRVEPIRRSLMSCLIIGEAYPRSETRRALPYLQRPQKS
jgi:hypothetical protein